MWIASDVCNPHDKTPSVYGYIYSHTELIGKAGSNLLSPANQNINAMHSCGGGHGGFLRFMFMASKGFVAYDITMQSIARKHVDATVEHAPSAD